MVDFCIQTVIHNRQLIFSASCQLPFSIVYGLCRRSKDDLDARDIILHTANSPLDVLYAIAKGLLTLHEKDDASGEMRSTELDLSYEYEGRRRGIPNPLIANDWKEDMTVYQYLIDPESALGTLLNPGKRYMIRLVSYIRPNTQHAALSHAPEPEDDDSQVRIIDGATAQTTAQTETTIKASTASLQIIDISTNTIVRAKPGPRRGLTAASADPRPRLTTVLIFTPDENLIRRVDISNLLKSLPGGVYRVEMRPRGVWWCFGDKDEIVDEVGEKVAR
ncbi:hypothetical protein RRF57_007153 [Xylaria bambusicola]|uniref:Uncharacterized protein n=1 Tax=Xylaria bambusicola TaxID=326684 RepID=A0AAN7UUP3_9PEZI